MKIVNTRISDTTLKSVVYLLLLLAPIHTAAADTFQVDQLFTNYASSGLGFASGGGANDELYFAGKISSTEKNVGSWLVGDLGSETAILKFNFIFDVEVLTDIDGDGAFDSVSDRGTSTFKGSNVSVTAVDGAFDGVFIDKDGFVKIGWEHEQFYSTQTDFGIWNSDLATLNNNGYQGELSLFGKTRATGESLFYDGTSLLSWLSLQYAPWADFSLDLTDTAVKITASDHPSSEVPEPTAVALLSAGLLSGWLRKKSA